MAPERAQPALKLWDFVPAELGTGAAALAWSADGAHSIGRKLI